MGLKTTRLSAAFVALALCFACQSAQAQQATSSDPQTPGSFGQTPVGRVVSGLNPMNWKMPKFGQMLPTKEEKTRIKDRKDGLMAEVKQTATRSWTKTKDVLNPKRLLPSNMFGTAAQPQQTASTTKEQPGFFGSLFTPQPEVRQVSSVNDFLSQERPITQ
jgi:hypothetical protein